MVVNSNDGSPILGGPGGVDPNWPDWSPDGAKIVFYSSYSYYSRIWVMNADGTGAKALTRDSDTSFIRADRYPTWSPDGRKIAFVRLRDSNPTQTWLMNADGSGQTSLSTAAYYPSWQPLPTATYPHPQSASQLNVSIVPAFRQCGTGGNPFSAKHAPSLATDSCNPPKPGSVLAAVGNTSQSSAQMTVVPGDADPTNGNQANVTITASLTDIQSTAGGDYNPNSSGADLTAVTRVRFTDKANGYGGLSATATEYDFRVPVDCSSDGRPHRRLDLYREHDRQHALSRPDPRAATDGRPGVPCTGRRPCANNVRGDS